MKTHQENKALTRIRPFDPSRTALLIIDVQNDVWQPGMASTLPYFHSQVTETVLPNLKQLLSTFRTSSAEVIYTVMENLTEDGRDRSLDYKLSNFFIAKGSWEAQVIEDVEAGNDEICLPKTSSGVFNSTIIEYLLRNMGIDTLVLTGFLTDQCVDHAVRDAADRGFYSVCVSDACATHTQARHEQALQAFSGYCRTVTTHEYLSEITAAR